MQSRSADKSASQSQTQASYPAATDLGWARLKTRLRLCRRWWLSAHAPFQPLLVIATWRSGSNLLLSYLRQQPNVSVLSEVLCSRLPIGPSRDQLPPEKAIQHIRYCLQGERAPIRGCKLMLHQLSGCGLSLDDLNRQFPTAKYIILYREQLAEQFISHRVAATTDQYLLREGETPRHAEIHVDPQELRAYCDDMRRRYRDVVERRWLEGKAVMVSYEELVSDPGYWLTQHICPLLAVPFAGAQTRLVKQSTRPLAERVVNYRDVAALLHSPLCRQQHRFPWSQTARRAA
jgi:LPS sulfotransferase NodH